MQPQYEDLEGVSFTDEQFNPPSGLHPEQRCTIIDVKKSRLNHNAKEWKPKEYAKTDTTPVQNRRPIPPPGFSPILEDELASKRRLWDADLNISEPLWMNHSAVDTSFNYEDYVLESSHISQGDLAHSNTNRYDVGCVFKT